MTQLTRPRTRVPQKVTLLLPTNKVVVTRDELRHILSLLLAVPLVEGNKKPRSRHWAAIKTVHLSEVKRRLGIMIQQNSYSISGREVDE